MGSRLDKNSAEVRKRINEHAFSDEAGEEYEASAFGGFPDYFRRKKIKLQNLDAELRASSDKPQIFKGVVAHVSGYTQPPLHVLHKELVQHGAGFLQYLDGKTMATHIIASAMPPKKAVEFQKYRIVKPAWVTDSIQAGKLLPWSDYRLVDDGPRQKTIGFDGGKMFSQMSRRSPFGYREEIGNSFYANQYPKSSARKDSQDANSSSPFQTPTVPRQKRTINQLEEIDDIDLEILKLPVSSPSRAPVEDEPESDLLTTKSENSEQAELPTSEISVPAESPKPLGSSKLDDAVSPSRKKVMTSEEHNVLLRTDSHVRKSTSANPDFLKQYYSESRLHHLSTWKAELKAKMQKLAAEKGGSRPKIEKRAPGARRYILHVDFDSFFCAVSLKKAPDYTDRPAVVAHGNGGGSEIASCNYPARKFGVKNGMWMKRALELCPDLKVLPYDFPAYEEASRLFYEAILEIGGVVQSVSIDEALIDVTAVVLKEVGSNGAGISEGSIWREQEKVEQIALELRQRIKEKTGCNVSVGMGGNILLAKVALRKAKPAGQYQIKPEKVLDMLGELKVEDLPGVAYSIGGKLEEIGVKLVQDLRQTSKERLTSVLGPKTGEKLWEYSRGIDRAEVGDQPVRKTVSAEVNWGIRFISQEEAEEFIRNLSKELERRLLNEGVKGKQLTMKIMRRALDAPLDPPKHLGHGKCDTFNKSILFGVSTNNAELLGKEAVAILRSYKFSPGDLRGIGVQLSKLEPLKSASVTAPDGSQKKISFGAAATMAPPAKRQKKDLIEEENNSPASAKPRPRTVNEVDLDPITEDPLTPKKTKYHPALALAKANEKDRQARTPINISGTQFIMPTNPDPAVLAELPQDIRSKLIAQGRHRLGSRSREASPAVSANSRQQSPAIKDGIPPEIDPEVFQALPEDVRAEVLASYSREAGAQRALPHSPRKDRVGTHPMGKKSTTPTKRGIRGAFSRAKERQQDADAKLLQTNFLPAAKRSAGSEERQELEGLEDLDPAVLAELPDDVRREVEADHRRRKQLQKAALNLQLAPLFRSRPAADNVGNSNSLPGGQTRLQFPPPPPRISFTSSALTSAAEVKDMLAVWHRETRDEGPHRADVEILEKYLARVVLEERDMEKARKLVVWLAWTVEEGEQQAGGGEGTSGRKKGRHGWRKAMVSVKSAVQEAVRERGLGPMDLG